jgi:hypothetical protein
MKTELVWEGKYDEYGNRREVNVAWLAMPMQRVESIDQPRPSTAVAAHFAESASMRKEQRCLASLT